MILVTAVIVSLQPLPAAVSSPGFQSINILGDKFLVVSYSLSALCILCLWYLEKSQRLSNLILLGIVSLLTVNFWYLVSPNPLLFNSGFQSRAYYIATESHIPSALVDQYANSLPGLYLIWDSISYLTGVGIPGAAYIANIVVGSLAAVLSYAISTTFLGSRSYAFPTALLIIVGNPFLFRGIEVDSLYGLTLLLAFFFVLLKRPSSWKLPCLLISLGALFLYPIPVIIILTGTSIYYVSSLVNARQRSKNPLLRQFLNWQYLVIIGIIWSAWVAFFGESWLVNLSLIVDNHYASVGASTHGSFIADLLGSNFLSGELWSVLIIDSWLFLEFAIPLLIYIYFGLRNRSYFKSNVVAFSFAPLVVAFVLYFVGGPGDFVRPLLYVPFFSVQAIFVLFLMLKKGNAASVIAVAITLLLMLPSMIAFFPNVGYDGYVQYDQTITAGSFIQHYMTKSSLIIDTQSITLEGYTNSNELVVPRFFAYSNSSSLVQSIDLMLASSSNVVFPYAPMFAAQVARSYSNATGSAFVNHTLIKAILATNVLYSNGLVLMAVG